MSTEILIFIPFRKDQKQSFSNWDGRLTSRAIERGGFEFFKTGLTHSINYYKKKLYPRQLFSIHLSSLNHHEFFLIWHGYWGAKRSGGIRFLERQGLNRRQIYRITDFLRNLLSSWVRFANMDLTEINPRKASGHLIIGENQTYRIAANMIKKLLWKKRRNCIETWIWKML